MWFSPVVSKITLPGIPLANRDTTVCGERKTSKHVKQIINTPRSLYHLILNISILSLSEYFYPSSLPPCDVLHRCHSQVVVIALSQPCVCCMCMVLVNPRLPVASYKNSFSMTEWRNRLEGSDQSSGTPFKDFCPAMFYFYPSICAPCVGKKKAAEHWAVFPLLLSYG